jgi:hypothetical protein
MGRSSNVIATLRPSAAGCGRAPFAATIATALMMLTTIAEILNLVLLHIPVVLLERAGKLVRAVVAADEVQ